VWTQESMQLRTVCDKRLYNTYTRNIGSYEAKVSIDIQQTFFPFFVTMLASLRTKFLLPTFYVFFRVLSKKRKSHAFLKSEKKTKNTYSRTLIVTQCANNIYNITQVKENVKLNRRWNEMG